MLDPLLHRLEMAHTAEDFVFELPGIIRGHCLCKSVCTPSVIVHLCTYAPNRVSLTTKRHALNNEYALISIVRLITQKYGNSDLQYYVIVYYTHAVS